MIELKNVSKYYRNSETVSLGLRNINLNLNVGEIVAIIGDSGSGKSTLLNVITAVDSYDEGEVYFNGEETSYFNQNDMDLFRKNHVAFIFQNYNIVDSYTVLQNVMLPLLIAGSDIAEARSQALKLIDKVGLSHRKNHKGTKLSGGEKQRCVIARALALNCEILACDEPTGNLDSSTGAEIIKLIKEVAQDKLVLIVTHNYAQVEEIATRKIKISDGEIVEDKKLKKSDFIEEPKEQAFMLDSKLTKKAFFKLILQNILNTPKKTIFSFIMLSVISFTTLLLVLLAVQSSYELGYSAANRQYSLISKDRMIAYGKNLSGFSPSKLDDLNNVEIIENAFYEEIPFSVKTLSGNFMLKYTTHMKDYEIVYGSDIQDEDNEALIIMPKNSANDYFSDFKKCIDEYIKTEFNFQKNLGKIVGIAISDSVISSYLYSPRDISPYLMETLINDRIRMSITDTETGISTSIYSFVYAYDDTTAILLPSKYKDGYEINTMFSSIYPCTLDVEVVFDDELRVPALRIGSDTEKLRPIFDKVYEVTIYTNNVDSVEKKLLSKDILVTIPAKTRSVSQFNLLNFYLTLFLMIFAIILLFFITYAILAKIYSSKIKDYGIMRTLGMIRKKMGSMVVWETIIIGLTSSMFSFLIIWITDVCTNYRVFPMLKFNNAFIMVGYFLLMGLFSFFLARRFNHRLFKFSIYGTLNGEEIRND